MAEKDMDLEQELEAAKKESAGKDRKISELLEDNKRLKAQGGAAEEGAPEEEKPEQPGADLLKRTAELLASLKAREQLAAAKEEAINKSIELGIPVSLGAQNATRWDAFEKEIDELAESIYTGMATKGPKPVYSPGKGAAHVWPKGEGLTYAKVAGMSKKELAHIPGYILEKFAFGEASS